MMSPPTTTGWVVGPSPSSGPENATERLYAWEFLLLACFDPRGDIYAVRFDDAYAAASMNAYLKRMVLTLDGPVREYVVGEWKPAGPRGERKPLRRRDLIDHILGGRTVGVYPLHPENTCSTVSVDFDNHLGDWVTDADPRQDYDALVAVVERYGLASLGNHSRGGKGYWLHLLLPFRTLAREARAVMLGLIREAGVQHITGGGTFDAIFPKQDELGLGPFDDPTSKPGALMCLPLNFRWLTSDPPGTGFVGVPRIMSAQFEHLEAKSRTRISAEKWAEMVERFPAIDTLSSARRAGAASVSEIPGSAPSALVGVTPEGSATSTHASAWQIALDHVGRLGRSLGDGKYAVLCIQDEEHSRPDCTASAANGSCVLFPPSDERGLGYPHCSHAHCADLTMRDWIAAVGNDVWKQACDAIESATSSPGAADDATSRAIMLNSLDARLRVSLGAAFTPYIIEYAAHLSIEDLDAFSDLRDRLERAGVPLDRWSAIVRKARMR